MIQAVGKFIVAVPAEVQKTDSGFVIPDEIARQFETAKVISVGEKVSVKVSEGDKILITSDNKKIKFEGEDYFIISEDKLAVVIK